MKTSGKGRIIKLNAHVQKVHSNRKGVLAAKAPRNQSSLRENTQSSIKPKEIQQVRNILAQIPDIRKKEVCRIKKSIENETYNINGKKVANKVVTEFLLDDILKIPFSRDE